MIKRAVLVASGVGLTTLVLFGRDAASTALFSQFETLIGKQGAEVFRKTVAAATDDKAGVAATLASVVTLIFTASGVFLTCSSNNSCMHLSRGYSTSVPFHSYSS